MSDITPPAAASLLDRFATVIASLCGEVAARSVRRQALTPLLMLVWTRLRGVALRFATVTEDVRAGRLRTRKRAGSDREAVAALGERTRRKVASGLRLPRETAWLIRLVPGTAQFAGQVQHLLDDPEMAALLQAAPQLARALRPLCRMLAIPVPLSLRRATARAPRAVAATVVPRGFDAARPAVAGAWGSKLSPGHDRPESGLDPPLALA